MATDNPDVRRYETLTEEIHGEVLRSGDDGYDEARAIWNAMIDRKPAIIVRPTGAADVITAISFAREFDLPLAVKGGGHNVAGNAVCDDGLLVDLSPMSSVRVDPAARTARVGAGATMADLDHETQAFGLATPGGVVSTTGVSGLTLGGGIGWLSRRYGLAVDNLESVVSSLQTGTSQRQARTRTRTSSGRSVVGVATSRSSRRSNSPSTR